MKREARLKRTSSSSSNTTWFEISTKLIDFNGESVGISANTVSKSLFEWFRHADLNEILRFSHEDVSKIQIRYFWIISSFAYSIKLNYEENNKNVSLSRTSNDFIINFFESKKNEKHHSYQNSTDKFCV